MKKIWCTIGTIILCTILMFSFSISAFASSVEVGQSATQVRIPLVLEISESIAGAEFTIELSGGLSSLKLEKAQVIAAATLTQVVEKNGSFYCGFFGSDNNYAPTDGQLNIGYLVLDYSGGAQTVTIRETRIVRLIDKDETASTVQRIPTIINITQSTGNTGGNSGGNNGSGADGGGTNIPPIIIIENDSTPLSGNMPFVDVIQGDWFYDAVKYVFDSSLMNGTSATTFAPNANLTRAMLVTILYRYEGEPSATGGTAFTDVPSGYWYSSAIAWASANGIVTGYGDGRFGTNDNITREQFATILMRYAAWKKLDTSKSADLTAFTDASAISSWALAAMKWANAEGLISGRTATTLAPSGNASRAEAATILMRFIEDVVK